MMSTKSGLRFRRKVGDPWVSTNRVLNGLGKRPGNGVGRNPNFDTDETKLLIQLWGDPKVQRALITTHKKHAVILQLAQKMQDFGYFRSAEEITTRIKNLKCFYNRIKKDIESGQESSTKPSWKHFSEMDAIMTRPIFSVRPDEVPAPSLKFRLEQAREEREERRKKNQSEGTLTADPTGDDSNDLLEDDSLNDDAEDAMLEDNLIPDCELDIDLNESLAAITQDDNAQDTDTAKRRKIDGSEDTNVQSDLKEEQNSNSNSSTEKQAKENLAKAEEVVQDAVVALLAPKQEPIDVDAEEDVNKAEQTANNNKIVSQLISMSSTPPTSTTTSAPTQGKISLVPTNFLMQPNKTINNRIISSLAPSSSSSTPQQFQLLTGNSQMQPRFIFSGAATSQAIGTTTNTGIINTPAGSGIMATGPGGMKVLLVNAEQAGAGTSSNAQFTTGVLPKFMPLNTGNMLQIQALPQQPAPSTLPAMAPKARCTPSPKVTEPAAKVEEKAPCNIKAALRKKPIQKTESQALLQHKTQFFQKHKQENLRQTPTQQQQEAAFTKKDATNLRILLRQLLNAQYESNAINSRRWKLERDRLEFEKSVADRCFNALPNVLEQLKDIFKPQSEQKQRHEQETQTPAPKPATQIFQATPFMTMSSSGSNIRLQPPKLLFTTVRHPTLMTLNSPALTKVVANNDAELVVPKEEPKND